ncbi:DNA topoisomerase IV subunit A [Chitinispirillales bacterium ANBcel5]|uniref:DNA topoisomerase IV subunit A n=1 Tax=Cellulosispirillum alkaliphilum TaxID=3039283 RepID=UPI002A595FF5|nr:DNA topoisomerase IV subunit A [Chitinispirillales bacterium ANBcel5]
MAFINNIYNNNFLEYASYVIKDRAIPHVNDGLKPVQRRILHTLWEVDDGKFHKVANVVGQCMKYHPHGDASIGDALVSLSNKEMFIDKQGNFGNILTGDPASAVRYIECRLSPLARETLFNPEITEFLDSYDGRNREPLTLPSKLPVLLAIGSEGIAVGMSTKILSHNLKELLEAQVAALRGEQFLVYPDFACGGFADVSEYDDGNGKVLVRAKLDTSDPKRIVIRELPHGTTTQSLISSIETATRKGKLKISGISDYTAEDVEIEIRLARGIRSEDTVDALYAFTDCESSISANMMVINNDDKPTVMTASEVIHHNSQQLVEILKAELMLEEKKLNDKLHAKTLEQIFIENRIYKKIEQKTTAKDVTEAVHKGLKPFQNQIKREVTDEDVETLLKIPIRRISAYDIKRAQKEMRDIRRRLREIKKHLAAIVDYAISFLEDLIEKYGKQFPRRTKLMSFKKVDVREAAQRNLKLRYEKDTGYLGYQVNGNVLFDVSQYDRVLVIRKSGAYSVMDVPDKLFVDKGMLYCGFVDKDLVFNVIYRDNKTKLPYLKRCKIDKFILNRGYQLVPDKCTILKLTTDSKAVVTLQYKPKPRLKVLDETFMLNDYQVKGCKAAGVRLANKEIKSVKISAG